MDGDGEGEGNGENEGVIRIGNREQHFIQKRNTQKMQRRRQLAHALD